MRDVVPLRYGTAFKKAFSGPVTFSRLNVACDLFAEDAAAARAALPLAEHEKPLEQGA
jgi:hypothetical protein